MTGLDISKHFSLTSTQNVKKICDEILKDLSITYFNYLKIYPDGSRALLTNNADWIKHFYESAIYETAGVIDIEYLLPKGYFLWSELDADDRAFTDAKEYFNIDNGISFVTKNAQSTTIYIFGSTRGNHTINSFYIRNINLLKRFILYFNDKAHDLIDKANENKIILPNKQIVTNRINKIQIDEAKRKSFVEKTPIDRFYFVNKEDGLYLTKRQKECAVYSLNGLTAKEIAKKLNLSYRTVDTYLEQVKNKLGCLTKKSLTKELLEGGFFDI